jgi:heme exporter protein D
MNWQSWSDFWQMGGYGLYVWGSMAMVAFLLVAEIVQARNAREQVWKELRAQQLMLDIE